MKRRIASLSMIFVFLAASTALEASQKVSVVEELVNRKLPPAKQRPREIASWHEAYLNEHNLIGSMLLKGTNRESVLDLAAKRGAHLVLIFSDSEMVGKIKYTLTRYESVGGGQMRSTFEPREKRIPGFYIEMFAPGVDYQEGARRFYDWAYPLSIKHGGYRISGTLDDLKRYLDLGVDPDLLLDQLVENGGELGDGKSYDLGDLPRMQAKLEMITLLLSRGAGGKHAAEMAANYLAASVSFHGWLLEVDDPLDVVWPPAEIPPADSSGVVRMPGLGQTFLAKVCRVLDDHRRR